MKRKITFLCSFLLISCYLFPQPYTDLANANYQFFSSGYRNDNFKNKTENYFLSILLPKEYKNGNVLMVRLSAENIKSSVISNYSSSLTSIYLPLGFQFVSSNKKWKTIMIVVPKIASDFRDQVSKKDAQLGGIFLENYIISDKLKIKAGLYYNREAFGNFFVPLAAVDWQATDRISLYGILPTNYKLEYNLIKNKLYSGLGFKSFTRSFRLEKQLNNNYVRYDEIQLKYFIDYFLYKRILIYGEIGYSLGKNPLQYTFNTKSRTDENLVYTPTKNAVIFNLGVAYRLRVDLKP